MGGVKDIIGPLAVSRACLSFHLVDDVPSAWLPSHHLPLPDFQVHRRTHGLSKSHILTEHCSTTHQPCGLKSQCDSPLPVSFHTKTKALMRPSWKAVWLSNSKAIGVSLTWRCSQMCQESVSMLKPLSHSTQGIHRFDFEHHKSKRKGGEVGGAWSYHTFLKLTLQKETY